MSVLSLAVAAAGSYLLGAVPFGYLVARARGVDILAQGSGNIGATNVGRVLGRRWGLLVFVLDFAKGALPVLAASRAASAVGEPAPGVLPVTAAVATFLGHLFPVYLGFHGGKGVATGVGTVAVLLPGIAAAVLLAWAALLAATRFVSVASLGAAALMLVLRLTLTPHPFGHDQLAVTSFCFLGTVLVWARHAANLRRLVRGTENRFEETPAMLLLGKTIHVLALGLWFGTVVFFTIMGLVVFDTFEKESLKEPRETWFPVAPLYDQPQPNDRFPHPLKKEQGSRAGGAVVGPLFPIYFGIQTACGALALITAAAWIRRAGGVHRARAALLLVAFLSVLGGWWLEHVVSDLRRQRNEKSDVLLEKMSTGRRSERLVGQVREEMRGAKEAREAFGRWHGYSLIVNMLTLLLVTVAMALAAALPATSAPPSTGNGQPTTGNESSPGAVAPGEQAVNVPVEGPGR